MHWLTGFGLILILVGTAFTIWGQQKISDRSTAALKERDDKIIELTTEIVELSKKTATTVEMNQEGIRKILSKLDDTQREQLAKKNPKGYEIAGLSKRLAVPYGKQIEGLSIEWSLIKIENVTSETVDVRLPDFSYRGASYKGLRFRIPRKVGTKRKLIKIGNIVLQAEVIYVKDDLTVIAFGLLSE